jgi:hypothetical protein
MAGVPAIVHATLNSVIKTCYFSECGRILTHLKVTLCCNRVTYFTLSNVFIFYQKLNTVHRKSLQQNRCFTLRIYFDVRDSNVRDGFAGLS